MQKVLEKLALARVAIKASKIQKDGKNTYSNYDYFTPEYVSKLVNEACVETNLICLFNLKHDEHGFYGETILTDMESGESLTTVMRTEKPSIKATNETQQMGGMNTYTKRYSLMSLFDIEDNSIDFDSHDNTQNTKQTVKNELPWLNKGTKEFDGAVKKLREGQTTIEKIKTVMRVSKEVEGLLKNSIKGQFA